MAQEEITSYHGEAVAIFNQNKDAFSPPEQALFLLGLAQVEALKAILEKLEEGITVSGDRKLHDAVLTLQTVANRMSRLG